MARTRFQRRQLGARRWPAGAYPLTNRGLCGKWDSPDKFNLILERLDYLQGSLEEETCPDEYQEILGELYGEFPTLAGQQIRNWFVQLFEEDEAQYQKARQELLQWIAKEKSDVQQDREFYQREFTLRRFEIPSTAEDTVAAKEAALERQIAEQTRLLLQLKSKRSSWAEPESEAEEAVSSASTEEPATGSGEEVGAEKGSDGGEQTH